LMGYIIKKQDGDGIFSEDIKIFVQYAVNDFGYVVTLTNFCQQYSSKYLMIEFSVPKVVHGSNVASCSPECITTAVNILYDVFSKHFSSFPRPEFWRVQRVDICWVWKFKTVNEVKKYIDYTKFLRYPRKNTHIYQTTTMYSGRSYTLRFYVKQPEYKKTDYKRLLKIDEKLALKFLDDSKNVIRFEVEVRKAELDHIFRKNITYKNLLSYRFFLNALAYYLSRFAYQTFFAVDDPKMSFLHNVFNFPKKWVIEKSDLSDFSSGVVTPLEIIQYMKGGDNYL